MALEGGPVGGPFWFSSKMLGAHSEGWRVLEERSLNQAGLDHSEPHFACARPVGPLKGADAPEEQSLSIGVGSGTIP